MRCHFWRVGERGGDRCCRPDSHSIMASLSSEGHRRTRRTRRKGDVPLLTLTLMLLKLRVTRGLFPLRDKSPFCQQKHIYFLSLFTWHIRNTSEKDTLGRNHTTYSNWVNRKPTWQSTAEMLQKFIMVLVCLYASLTASGHAPYEVTHGPLGYLLPDPNQGITEFLVPDRPRHDVPEMFYWTPIPDTDPSPGVGNPQH